MKVILTSNLSLPDCDKLGKDVYMYHSNIDNYFDLSNFINSNFLSVRHIQPANNIDNLDFSNLLETNKSYSIQIRSKNRKYLYHKIKSFLSNFIEDIKNPEQVISIYDFNGNLYGGVSNTKCNLSRWCAGECRYKINNIISRAEMKLHEAIEVFDIDVTRYKTAMDVGCSPGGWSKVLLDYGISVLGIDPANVDGRILKYKNFNHLKCKAEDFRDNRKFDIIVNDMKMEYKRSIDITSFLVKNLNKDGLIILTVKLFKNQNIGKSVNYLKKNFNILEARQLYHNRNEYTALLSPF